MPLDTAPLITGEKEDQDDPGEDPGEDPPSPPDLGEDKGKSTSNPFRGEPGSESTTTTEDGEVKQIRKYGEDGYPEKDIDYDHDHGQGKPHLHDWGRPEDGSSPTHRDRGIGRSPTEGEL